MLQVIPPFNLMPREALEHSCNAVIGGLVRSLLPVFMRQLAADYKVGCFSGPGPQSRVLA